MRSALILSLALLAAPALAQTGGRAGLRSACMPDLKKLCSDVQPGGGRILKCMQDNRAQLSDACRAALDARKKP